MYRRRNQELLRRERVRSVHEARQRIEREQQVHQLRSLAQQLSR